MNSIRIFCRTIRVKSYIKNIFVFSALFFSYNLSNLNTYKNTLLAFLSFCLVSSSVYILNDLKDMEKDKLHPVKRNRPIASGEMKPRLAVALAAIFVLGALLIAFFISHMCLIIILAYFSINILYSWKLKKYALFDVYCIAVGFLLRVLIGAAAIDVSISNYLLLTVLSLSMFMGFAKRYAEAKNNGNGNGTSSTRDSLKRYSLDFLKISVWAMMILSCLFYSLWTIDKDVIARVGSNELVFTVPIVLMGFLEYIHAMELNGEGDPTVMVYKNKKLMAIVLFFIVSVLYILYFLKHP